MERDCVVVPVEAESFESEAPRLEVGATGLPVIPVGARREVWSRLEGVKLERPARTADVVDCCWPHAVVIGAGEIKRLCAPVRLPEGGVKWTAAAYMLGMHEENLRSWIKRGALRMRRERFSHVESRGKLIPVVEADCALDPSANLGAPPDPVFGSLWQWMHERVDEGFEQMVIRVPRFRPYPRKSAGNGLDNAGLEREEMRFRGWDFLCPGCHRVTAKLYLPMPVWTMVKALGEDPLVEVGEGMEGANPPGTAGANSPGAKQFACGRCHKVCHYSLLSRNGWNQFIMHLTAGVLEGRDVAKPDWVMPRRKRRYAPHRRRGSPEA